MIQTIRKAWGVPELRKKIVFTLLILLIFRLGNADVYKRQLFISIRTAVSSLSAAPTSV